MNTEKISNLVCLAGLRRVAGALSLFAAFSAVCLAADPAWPAGLTTQTQTPPGAVHPSEAAHPQLTTNAASSSAVMTNNMENLDDKHILAIGDRLSFRIVEDEGDPIAMPISDSGEVEVPYIHLWSAEGKTCKQLAFEIKKALEKDFYYQATVIIAVEVMTKSRGKVYLVGPVRVPGPLEIPSDEVFTLSKAILRAGGFGDFADRRNVRVTRKAATPGGAEQKFIVNVENILEKGKSEGDLVLEPGDLIYVPDKVFRY